MLRSSNWIKAATVLLAPGGLLLIFAHSLRVSQGATCRCFCCTGDPFFTTVAYLVVNQFRSCRMSRQQRQATRARSPTRTLRTVINGDLRDRIMYRNAVEFYGLS